MQNEPADRETSFCHKGYTYRVVLTQGANSLWTWSYILCNLLVQGPDELIFDREAALALAKESAEAHINRLVA